MGSHDSIYSPGSLYEKNVETQGTNIDYQLKKCHIYSSEILIFKLRLKMQTGKFAFPQFPNVFIPKLNPVAQKIPSNEE